MIPARYALLASALLTAPVAAQPTDDVARRVTKLEREMAAVQREVFPGGAPRFFEGEVAAAQPASVGPGASAPIADLTMRVDAIERRLSALTNQIEQTTSRLQLLERDYRATARAIEESKTTGSVPAANEGEQAASRPVVADRLAATAAKPAATPSAKPAADRLARVKAVPVPATGDAAEDSYSYGFRLWEAKLYPEAQTQLKSFMEKHPKHPRATYAQNLLGRAYLDDGKASFAAVAFFNNYKDRPQGARAPHSLMYMGLALEQLKRPADACKAFKELDDVYGATLPADVRREADAGRKRNKC